MCEICDAFRYSHYLETGRWPWEDESCDNDVKKPTQKESEDKEVPQNDEGES